jgi:hypothetical protein
VFRYLLGIGREVVQECSLVRLSKIEERRLQDAGLVLDAGNDAVRWKRLAESYFNSGLWKYEDGKADEEFDCCHARECGLLFARTNGRTLRSDHRGTVANYFSEGYDRLRSESGTPVRVCLVSLDSGGWTFGFGTQTKLDKVYGLDFDNQHWRETRKLMHYLFFGKWSYDLAPTLLPVKLFVHIRALKCNGGSQLRPPLEKVLRRILPSAATGATRWKPNALMYDRCCGHLAAELGVLEPTIIIAQGFTKCFETSHCTTHSVIQAMNSLTGAAGSDISHRILGNGRIPDSIALLRWDTPWGSCILIGSYHPSAQGLYTQHGVGALDAALKPAIEWIRKQKFAI